MTEQQPKEITDDNLGVLNHYKETNRVKVVLFKDISTPQRVLEEFQHAHVVFESGADDLAQNSPDNCLIQVRFIMEQAQIPEIEAALGIEFAGQGISRAHVIGQIPFFHPGKNLALYYAQIEKAGRLSYPFPNTPIKTHEDAVHAGLQKRQRLENRPLPNDFVVEAVNYPTGQYWRFNQDQPEEINAPFYREDALEKQIIDLHKRSFAYAHDSGQRESIGIHKIMDNNITLLCYRLITRELAALTYFEVDRRFTFSNIALIETTYFTDPQFRSQGISVHMRLAAHRLINQSDLIKVYQRQPILLFNESVRFTSFPLCLQVGCELGGDLKSDLNGNLGDSYTYIGPANPLTGFMPMGLTYFVDQKIALK